MDGAEANETTFFFSLRRLFTCSFDYVVELLVDGGFFFRAFSECGFAMAKNAFDGRCAKSQVNDARIVAGAVAVCTFNEHRSILILVELL